MSLAQGAFLVAGLFMVRLDGHLYWGQLRWESAALYFAGVCLCVIAVRIRR